MAGSRGMYDREGATTCIAMAFSGDISIILVGLWYGPFLATFVGEKRRERTPLVWVYPLSPSRASGFPNVLVFLPSNNTSQVILSSFVRNLTIFLTIGETLWQSPSTHTHKVCSGFGSCRLGLAKRVYHRGMIPFHTWNTYAEFNNIFQFIGFLIPFAGGRSLNRTITIPRKGKGKGKGKAANPPREPLSEAGKRRGRARGESVGRGGHCEDDVLDVELSLMVWVDGLMLDRGGGGDGW